MKLVLSIILFFTLGLANEQPKQEPTFKLTTFTNVPQKFSDCDDASYFLSESDVKKGKFICVTNYETALIYINNRPITVKLIDRGYLPGKYSIIINDGSTKDVGDETWTIKSVITIKYDKKIVWRRNLIGYGGC